MAILFITRKYPPASGGMETFSYQLTSRYPGGKIILSLGRKSRLHLFWFIPYCLFHLASSGRRYQLLHLGDMVLVGLGCWAKLFNHRIKVVISAHGLDLAFASRSGLLPLVYRGYLQAFRKPKLAYNLVVCNSRYTASLAGRFGFSPTQVIPIGIGKPGRVSASQGDLGQLIGQQPKGQRYLLTVGRLVRRKGVKWFVKQVMPLLPANIVYLVAGEPSKGKNGGKLELEVIKQAVVKTKLSDRVFLLGKVSDQQLELLYRSADLFVMPNIMLAGDPEGFGIVALEAASRGLPVVASRLEGISDAVQDGKNGFLLPSGDAKAFHKKIVELLGWPGLAGFGQAASRYTIQHYSWDKLISRYQDCFERLIAS